MRRIRLIKVAGTDKEEEVVSIPVDDAQQKLLKDNFNGWPTAVTHSTGVYFLEDWDATEAVYVFSSHIKVDGETFTIPENGKFPQLPGPMPMH